LSAVPAVVQNEMAGVGCRYVRGDFRFKSYCKSNPRKMVKVWAEKEFRNLSRLKAAGVRCPAPVHLRMHVLLMEFVGANGVAAPRLKVHGLSYMACPFAPLAEYGARYRLANRRACPSCVPTYGVCDTGCTSDAAAAADLLHTAHYADTPDVPAVPPCAC
jgi:hypothetical protein